MNLDDPKVTAFVLDELDEPEKAKVAQAIAGSPEAEREVVEIRGLAEALRQEFAADLKSGGPASAAERQAVHDSKSLSDIHDDRWFWTRARPLGIAAGLAVLGLLATIIFGGRYLEVAAPPGQTAEIELVDGNTREKLSPDSISNPLEIGLINRVDHVVVAEVRAGGEGEERVRVVEQIQDPARVARLKKSLTSSELRHISTREGNSSEAYRLMFLDPTERVVACAAFSCPDGTEPILRLLPRANNSALPGRWQSQFDYAGYAIPFPEWKETIGSCPGAG